MTACLPEHQEQKKTMTTTSSSSFVFQILTVFSVCYLCISCGTFLGYTSSAIGSLTLDDSFNYTLTNDDISWIGSLGAMGAVFGSVLATIPVKYFGVKGTMLYCSLPAFLCSWLTITMSSSISTILVGRFVGGIGTGMTMACAPMYVISIVSTAMRGRLGVVPQFLMIFGILVSYTIGTFVNWNEHALSCLFITLPAIAFLYFAPDTPRWLLLNGKTEEALCLLEKLHGKVAGLEEFDRLRSHTPNGLWGNLPCSDSGSTHSIRSKISSMIPAIKAITLALGLMTFQQLSGINGVTFYAVSIFQQSSGVDAWGPNLPSIILSVTQCISSLIATLLIDRIGRKSLLLISSAATGLASASMGIYFYIIHKEETEGHYDHLFWLPLAILITFAFGFAIGFGPVPYVYVTEILPEEIRAVFNPLIVGYTWLCVFAVTKSFPILTNVINLSGVFWVFSACSAMALVFIAVFIPETKGKSLEEVRQYFMKRQSNSIDKCDQVNGNNITSKV